MSAAIAHVFPRVVAVDVGPGPVNMVPERRDVGRALYIGFLTSGLKTKGNGLDEIR